MVNISTDNEYWKDRDAKANRKMTEKNEAELEKLLRRAYYQTSDYVIKEFEDTFYRIVNQIHGDEIPSPALLYKLDTYWQFQFDINQELQKLGDTQINMITEAFVREYKDVYEGLHLPSQLPYKTINKETALQVINKVWCADGMSWSERIWKDNEKLRLSLNEGLTKAVVTGMPASELKWQLQRRFDVSYSRASTIVRTELSHVQNEAARDRYKAAGCNEVEIWADEDERRCEICGELHQKRYPVDATLPVPAHPNCRCSVLPVVEGLDNKQ